MLRRNAFEFVVLIAAALIISWQLFVPPWIGIADNGDFSRFFSAGLRYFPMSYEDRYFGWVNPRYEILDGTVPGGYLSSTEILVRVARWTGIWFIDDSVFDIRVLGAQYSLLLLLGICLLLVASRGLPAAQRVLLAILLMLMLTDASYIAGFNSFYSEPTALVFGLLAIACALLIVIGRKSRWLVAGYFAASAMLLTSKPMYAPFAVLFAPFGVFLSRRLKLSIVSACLLAVFLCSVAGVYYSLIPSWLRKHASYISVFDNLLPNSPTPEQDLNDLGLDPEWAEFKGRSPYGPDSPLNKSPRLASELRARVGATTVARFYLSRPSRLGELLDRCSRQILSYPNLGYYEKSSGRPACSPPRTIWYGFKGRIFAKSIWTVLGFFAFVIGATVIGGVRASTSRARDLVILFGFLIAVAFLQFFVPALTLGDIDLSRYLVLFNLVFDFSLIILALASLHWLMVLFGAVRTRAGTRQHATAGPPVT
jgi:hypothetical protein